MRRTGRNGWRWVIAALLIAVLVFGLGAVLRVSGLGSAANVAQIVSLASFVVGLARWPRAGRRAAEGRVMPAAEVWDRQPRRLSVVRIRDRRQQVPFPPSLRAVLEYQREHAERHQYAYTVGIAPPVQEIYVRQQTDWRRQAPESGGVSLQLTLQEMLRASRHALVLAEPGVGKSTAVARVIWQQSGWLLGDRQVAAAPYGAVVPFLLPADLHGCSTLAAAMARQWELMTGADVGSDRFERTPPWGDHWLVLIDGIDQILSTAERGRTLEFLSGLTANRDLPYRLMITSRPLLSGELGLLKAEHIGRFTLREFGDVEVAEFARRWVAFRESQHVPGLEVQPISAEMFSAAVRDASLTSLVRVPLIATITALVLESAQETSLPTSLAGLYGRFVFHLFSSRRFREIRARAPRQFTHSSHGREAWAWLVDHAEDLLEGTADLHLAAGAPGIIQCARQWAESNGPASLLARVPGWDDGLKDLLTATSLVVPGDEGLRFAHQNLAEYLASGPRAARIAMGTWLADVLSPDSRSLALLMLARESMAAGALGGRILADERANLLLDRGGTDAIIAGDIIAHGIGVSPVTYARVVDDLFGRLERDQADTDEAIGTLIKLTSHEDVVDRLTAFADDQAQPDWIRAEVATRMRAVSRAAGVRLLRKVLYGTQDQLLQERILLTLAANGEKMTPGERARITTHNTMEITASQGFWAGHWYQQIAADGNADFGRRLRALLAMAERRDTGWQDLLADVITAQDLPDDTRLDAARRIVRLADQEGPGVISEIAGQPGLDPMVRAPLLASLAEADEGARATLRRLAADGGREFRERFPAILEWTAVPGTRSSEQRGTYVGSKSAETGAVPMIWGDVPPRDKNFTGRDDLLAQLREAASSQVTALAPGFYPDVSPTQGLQGLGGVGKTAVAIEYAYRFRSDYDLVWWIRADQLPSVRASLASLAQRLQPDADFVAGIDGLVTAALDALRRGEPYSRWLLIFDNADQPEDIQNLIPSGPGDVLITSRNPRWESRIRTLSMDVFLREDSREFLRNRVPRGLSEADADRLAAELGDLPLALEQAGAMLAETGMPADEYLRQLKEEAAKILNEKKSLGHPYSITAAWRLSVDLVRLQVPEALKVLRWCAFFGSEPIPRRIFYCGKSFAESGSAARLAITSEPIAVARAVRELARYALITISDGSIAVHRLIAALIRDELSAEEQGGYRHDAHLLLAAAAPGNPDDETLWPRYAELLPHALSSPMALDECPHAAVRDFALEMVSYLNTAGDPITARQFADRCIRRWTTLSDPSDPIIHTAQRHLNTALILLGERADDG